ncbi:MAG: CehA/McbA family metallohydrolase [Anaerolineales bacterium]|nr:CehA/McbA family metallohydrolase [Anaerolineales bacterium]
MPEIAINLHMHTQYSDGSGSHQDIADAALKAGLDAVIVTDHNILVKEHEGYYKQGNNKVLLLVGEEIHDLDRDPQKNHLLVFGVDYELADQAKNPGKLIKSVQKAGGLSFLAHPIDPAAPLFGEKDYSWENWDISGYTGIELWNGFSEFKTRLNSKTETVFYAYLPKRYPRGPIPETLKLWDQLTSKGQKIVAIGGSDAHARSASLGPFKRILFPYIFHFRAVNTHVILPYPLSGDLIPDKKMLLNAMGQGHTFVGYDLPYPTNGFQFMGSGTGQSVIMGDEISLNDGVTLQITLPLKAECILIKDGQPVKTWKNRQVYSFAATQSGVYRIEVYLQYKGSRRGWIFSNPIYIR